MVRTDVMAETAIIPVQEQAVEPIVDGPTSPLQDGIEQWGNGFGPVRPARVVIVGSVGLLPAGRADEPSMHLDFMVILGMQIPKSLESSFIQPERIREGPREKPMLPVQLI